MRCGGILDWTACAQLVRKRTVRVQCKLSQGAGISGFGGYFLRAGQKRAESVSSLKHHEESGQRFLRGIGNVSRRPADLLQPEKVRARLDRFELGDPGYRSHDLNPPEVASWFDAVDLRETIIAVLLLPKISRERIKSETKAVADAI